MLIRTIARISGLMVILAFLVTPLSTTSVLAAPGTGSDAERSVAQNVDWMTADQAARLALDFPVLVPSWIPAPFGGAPSIQASSGYYSLYWMISGGSPTFLQVTGEVGGGLPAGSPADLNNELSINSSVQGYDAIHDVTSIYDNVWWIAGGVLYTVSSNNMIGTDSLSLANSLVALQQPSAPEPEPTPTSGPEPTSPTPTPESSVAPTPTPAPAADPDPVVNESESDEAASGPTATMENAATVESGESLSVWAYPSREGTMRATDGVFVDSGETFTTGVMGGEVVWQSPAVSTETVVEFTLVDAMTGEETARSSVTVVPVTTETGDDSASTDLDEATEAIETGADETSLAPDESSEPPVIQTPESGGTNGASVSDGTAGAEIPRGADGTGGTRQVIVP